MSSSFNLARELPMSTHFAQTSTTGLNDDDDEDDDDDEEEEEEEEEDKVKKKQKNDHFSAAIAFLGFLSFLSTYASCPPYYSSLCFCVSTLMFSFAFALPLCGCFC